MVVRVPDQRIWERGETILPGSWFCTILLRSLNVTNKTEENTLALLCT